VADTREIRAERRKGCAERGGSVVRSQSAFEIANAKAGIPETNVDLAVKRIELRELFSSFDRDIQLIKICRLTHTRLEQWMQVLLLKKSLIRIVADELTS
jgi:hypothetical protein